MVEQKHGVFKKYGAPVRPLWIGAETTKSQRRIGGDGKAAIAADMSKQHRRHEAGIAKVRHDFAAATRRALAAGFEVIEIYAAHGYQLNSFLFPLTNKRTDAYCGSLENRMRLPLEIAAEMRGIIPQDKPLFVRISAVDGSKSGVTIEDSIALARELKKIGVDVIDCSSGGIGKT